MIVSQEEQDKKLLEILQGKGTKPNSYREYAKWYAIEIIKHCAEVAECCEGAIIDVGHTITGAFVDKQSILNVINEL